MIQLSINEAPQYIKKSTALTIGKFDGFHLGHQLLLNAVRKEAVSACANSAVITFSGMKNDADKDYTTLLTQQERNAFLEKSGIDFVVELPFSEQLRQMSADDFVEDILIRRFHGIYAAVGEDFRFGYQRLGTPQTLALYAAKNKDFFKTETFPKARYKGSDISSTRIRGCLSEGMMEDVAAMLGRPFPVTGRVMHGKALGRTMGFPTLNIIPEKHKLLPPRGVYFASVLLGGKLYRGMANLGIQPTVGRHMFMLEVHVLDFSEEVYGEKAAVYLHHFSRPEKKFEGLAALKSQLSLDLGNCRAFFEKTFDKQMTMC